VEAFHGEERKAGKERDLGTVLDHEVFKPSFVLVVDAAWTNSGNVVGPRLDPALPWGVLRCYYILRLAFLLECSLLPQTNRFETGLILRGLPPQ
jgi:hypothetical protein